jgi:LacI family transcriptional regulator
VSGAIGVALVIIERMPTPPRPATLRDVALRAGVHVTTASRALDPAKSSKVNPVTARRVRAAARALSYQPNEIARGLRTNRSMSVAVLVPDLTNPLFPPIVRGAENVLSAVGYMTLVVNTDDDAERQGALLHSLRGRKVDGFIVATAHRDDAQLDQARAQGVPIVLVNRGTDTPGFPSIVGDDQGGIKLAVRHLIELGHGRIGHVAGPGDTTTGYARLRAFQQATDDAGLESGAIARADGFTIAGGALAMRRLLAEHPQVTGVVAANDLIALGCLDALAEAGLSCPRDVSLVGFNDMPLADRLSPALTTVHVPHHAIGGEAARVLLELLGDPQLPPKSVTLPVRLVVRESTAPPSDKRG